MAKYRLLAVGKSGMELHMSLPRIPARGESIVSNGDYNFWPQGRGVVLSLALTLLGAEPILCSRIGEDFFGNSLLRLLRESGVDTRFTVRSKKERSSLSLHLEEHASPSREVLFAGAADSMGADDIENAFLSLPDAVLLSTELPASHIRFATELACEKEIPVFFLAKKGENIPSFGKGGVHAFCLDADAAEELSGIRPAGQEESMRCMISLSKRFRARFYVLRLPGDGYYVFDGSFCRFLDSCPAKSIDESTSEEAFLASLAVMTLEKKDIFSAARFAVCAHALASARLGGIDSLPAREDILRFAERCSYPLA